MPKFQEQAWTRARFLLYHSARLFAEAGDPEEARRALRRIQELAEAEPETIPILANEIDEVAVRVGNAPGEGN